MMWRYRLVSASPFSIACAAVAGKSGCLAAAGCRYCCCSAAAIAAAPATIPAAGQRQSRHRQASRRAHGGAPIQRCPSRSTRWRGSPPARCPAAAAAACPARHCPAGVGAGEAGGGTSWNAGGRQAPPARRPTAAWRLPGLHPAAKPRPRQRQLDAAALPAQQQRRRSRLQQRRQRQAAAGGASRPAAPPARPAGSRSRRPGARQTAESTSGSPRTPRLGGWASSARRSTGWSRTSMPGGRTAARDDPPSWPQRPKRRSAPPAPQHPPVCAYT